MLFRVLRQFSEQILHFWKGHIGPRITNLLSLVQLGGLLISVLGLWGFAAIAEEVLDKETQAFDTQILLAIRQLHTPLLNQIMIGITTLGEPTILAIASLGVGLLLLWRRYWAELATMGIAVAGGLGLNMLLKDAFARDRPELWNRILDVRYYSFPSGHAMVSLVVYGVLAYLLGLQFPRHRGPIFTIATVLILMIGFSRLYLGVHWPTDVVAGFAAGTVWLLACLLTLEIGRRYRTQQRHKTRTELSSDRTFN